MLLRLEGANEGNPKTEISNREIFSSYSAVAGWRGSGKPVVNWSLPHQDLMGGFNHEKVY